MASEIYINIKDLPELSQINNGDYLLIETSTGTHILNFENLLLPIQNTVITTTVNQNASAFTNLSFTVSSINSDTQTVSSNLEDFSSNVSTALSSINATIESNMDKLSAISNAKIKNSQVTIKQGDTTASTIVNIQSEIDNSNVLITPVNKYAALYPAYVDSVDSITGLITIKGTFNNSTATFNTALSTVSISTNYISAEEDAIYNVFVVKN